MPWAMHSTRLHTKAKGCVFKRLFEQPSFWFFKQGTMEMRPILPNPGADHLQDLRKLVKEQYFLWRVGPQRTASERQAG